MSTYEDALQTIRTHTTLAPDFGLVLGSGLGSLVDILEDRIVIPYSEIAGWPQSTVHGHSGNLVFGTLEGKSVVVQQGRAHFYEGYRLDQVTFPIRVMHMLGVKTIILTNAAGGLNKDFRAGDIMLLNDHINLLGMSGHSPLTGPNDENIGPRFLGMVHTYDAALRSLAKKVAADNGIAMHEGVYVGLSGPTFETPAEVRMLRAWGGDAVGMSTVHEVVVARHAGLRVLAFSSITNEAIDRIDDAGETNHEEVLETGKIIVPKLTTILRGVLGAF